MWHEKVNTIFLSGEKYDKTLFECAFYWAERGETIWYICPKQIDTIPTGLDLNPQKEILELIYFIYISETTDLLKKLCEIHECTTIPKIIIVSEIDYYWFSVSQSILGNAALLSAFLIESLQVYYNKYNHKGVLITAATNPVLKHNKLQTIIDLYFKGIVHDCNDENFDIKQLFTI